MYVCYIVLWKTLLQPNRGSDRIRTVCMYMSVALHQDPNLFKLFWLYKIWTSELFQSLFVVNGNIFFPSYLIFEIANVLYWLLSETIVAATSFDSQISLPQRPKKLLPSFLLVFLGVSGHPQAPQKNALPGRNKVAGAKDWNELKVVRAFFFWAWMPLTLYTLSCMYINIYTYIHIHIYIYIQTVCIIPRVCEIQIHMIHTNEVENAYEGVQWLFLIKCY